MNKLVKILGDNHWHLIYPFESDESTFCEGDWLSDNDHQTKEVKRGGITCRKCLKKIKEYKSFFKSIKL